MASLLSLDFGTGGVRAGVFDIAAGRMVAVGSAPYRTHYPQSGWAEQAPEEWWEALGPAVRDALGAAGNPAIAGIAVATTASTVVACRRDGTVLRPAILWMDARAAAESRFTETVEHPALLWSGGGDAVEWLVPKAMWLARNEPGLYAEAEVICEAVDYVNFRLTGEWAGSRLNATCKWNYDPLGAAFSPDLFAAFGVPDLTDKVPNRIVPVGGAVGRLSPDVADRLGIAGAPVVAQGGIDAHIGVLGAGTVAPGGMLMIAGTSVVHLVHADTGRPVAGIWGPYPHALVDGLWLIEGGQVSAGSILSWLTERIFGLDSAGSAALVEEASRIEPGSCGLVTLDYWMGNRTPYRDPDLRGAILGLSLWHDRASIYRSAVDAIALGSANVVFDLMEKGVAVDRIVLAGGITKNPLWLRATVDAIGLPIEVAREDNLSLLGGAVAAANAVGAYPSLEAASSAFAPKGEMLMPDPAAHRRYREMLALYREATETVAELAHRLAREPVGQREAAQ